MTEHRAAGDNTQSCPTCGAITSADGPYCPRCGHISGSGDPAPGRRRQRLELLSAILLAAASVATALSLYQATRWNGAMLFDFNESARIGAQARTETTRLAVDRAADVAAWSAFREAEESGDIILADYLPSEMFSDQLLQSYPLWEDDMATAALAVGYDGASYFRYQNFIELPHELQINAVRAVRGISYEEARALISPETDVGTVTERAGIRNAMPPSPMDHESYLRSRTALSAEQATENAEALFASARKANLTSDRYVLATVLFSLTLFFAGIAAKFNSTRLQAAMVALSGVFLTGGTILFISLPFR